MRRSGERGVAGRSSEPKSDGLKLITIATIITEKGGYGGSESKREVAANY
jgi:hypothetical protein